MNLRKLPFFLAGAVTLHFIGMVVFGWIMDAAGIADTFPSNIYMVVFLAPELIWSSPWFGVLGRFGLMEGEWWRMPSFIGLALVDFIYVLVLTVLGIGLHKRGG